ncbi:MAG: YlmC/YmxH family sporulation protein [Oscillospiraceae bacterium]
MNCRITDLRCKDVINLCDGTRLGCVCDVEVDTCNAKIVALIIYGRWRCFGLLGREDDIIINWCDIKVIGCDSILVNKDMPIRRRRFFGNS